MLCGSPLTQAYVVCVRALHAQGHNSIPLNAALNCMEFAMKCVQMSNGSIVRVTENVAQSMVNKGARYVSKEQWKKQGRQYFVVPREAKANV